MTYQPFLLTEELHITQNITHHYFENNRCAGWGASGTELF